SPRCSWRLVEGGPTGLKISVACWKIVLLSRDGATLATCATGGSQAHPRLRQAYFAKTVPVTGPGLREGNLPPKVSQFDSTSDTEVILVIQLYGVDGATVRGTLTDGRGLAKPFEQTSRAIGGFRPVGSIRSGSPLLI